MAFQLAVLTKLETARVDYAVEYAVSCPAKRIGYNILKSIAEIRPPLSIEVMSSAKSVPRGRYIPLVMVLSDRFGFKLRG